MRSDVALQLMGELFWNALLICAPVLVIVLVIGVLVGIFQVVTQIQEISLTFIPKIVAAMVAVVTFGGWMLHKLLVFSADLIARIPSYL
jgi:flagellar biosynthetic protein FliQ